MRFKLFLVFSALILVGHYLHSAPIQEQASEALNQLHLKANQQLRVDQADSMRYYALKGKALAQEEAVPSEEAYFNYVLGISYRKQDYPLAKQYLDSALNISLAVGYDIGAMLVYDSYSNQLRRNGHFDSAIYYSSKSRAILNSLPDSRRKSSALASSNSTMGLIYLKQGDYSQALENFTEAYRIANREGFALQKYYYRENIAGVNMQLGQYALAETQLLEVLSYADSADNASLKASSLLALGEVTRALVRYDESIGHYQKLMAQAESNDNIRKHELYYEVGRLYLEMKQPDSASYYFDLVAQNISSGDLEFQIDLNKARAETLLQKRQYSEALTKANKALALTGTNQPLEERSQILGLISEIYMSAGNFEAGHQYYLQEQAIKDSLFSLENLKTINALKLGFETELQTERINLLELQADTQAQSIERKNQLIQLSIAAALLLIATVYFAFRQRAIKAQNSELLAKQRLSGARINPHFLFNSLSAIQELILNKNDVIATSDYLAKFSKLTRQMLNYTDLEHVSLEKELGFLKNYLELQQLRFEHGVDIEIDIESSVNPDQFLVPPLITQPFAENAFEHGFKKSEKHNRLKISIAGNTDQIQIEIEDNGIGIQKSMLLKSGPVDSKAISLTRSRLALWQKKTGKLTELMVVDLSELNAKSTGTKVTLSLPNL